MIEWLQNFGTLLALLGVLASTGVYLYTISKRGRADVVRQDNVDLRASNQELRQNQAGHLATITSQADTIKNLREVATQTPEVKALLAATAKQQVIINTQHTDVIAKLSDLAEAISNMTAEFSKVVQAMAVNTKAQDTNTIARDSNTASQDKNTTARRK